METETTTSIQTVWRQPAVVRLLEKVLSGDIAEIKPTPAPSSELGFSYPETEEILGLNPARTAEMLDSLAELGILERRFSDKIFLCPYCQSANLRPSLRCPKCGAGNINRARILEHMACKYVGPEPQFINVGKYVCPQCKRELKFLATDYHSLGIKYVCSNCNEIFTDAIFKWQCLKCLLTFDEHEAKMIPFYNYCLDENRRNWLEFELKPKKRLMVFLQNHGYEVLEQAKVTGRSGAEHIFDIVARHADGLCSHTIVIDAIIRDQAEELSLSDVFSFDDKAYDCGVHDKILIVSCNLDAAASKFAERQRTRVLSIKELDKLIFSARLPQKRTTPPFALEDRPRLVQWLKDAGYGVRENARVTGRSGISHNIDIVAERDDGVVKHVIGFGILAAEKAVGLEAVAFFDAKAYDSTIYDKVILATPRLSEEAMRFARKQGITIFELPDPRRLVPGV